MQRALTSLIGLILLAGGMPAHAAGAQVATPDAGDFKLDRQADPGSFTFFLADGTELATYTVLEVIEPFDDAAEGFAPA